ncbi:MAG TPA: hypothetical protein VG900_13785 [Hyphomicrobiaceae bacterium]|nr:hypothetical protein [Hyphomicrobiaceae bacterium]
MLKVRILAGIAAVLGFALALLLQDMVARRGVPYIKGAGLLWWLVDDGVFAWVASLPPSLVRVLLLAMPLTCALGAIIVGAFPVAGAALMILSGVAMACALSLPFIPTVLLSILAISAGVSALGVHRRQTAP